jgi:hypothetical protein
MTNPAAAEQDLQDELSYYTLAHGDPEFVHQHIVDAFAAQLATPNSKPIQVVFALIGLYLHQERGFTGRQVQLAHMRLGTPRRNWTMLASRRPRSNSRGPCAGRTTGTSPRPHD